MKTMKWLLRREYWEHKGAFFWAPVAIAALLLAFLGGTIIYAAANFGHEVFFVNGQQVATTATIIDHISPEHKEQIARVVASNYLAIAAPLFAALPFVVFFYCLSALYD